MPRLRAALARTPDSLPARRNLVPTLLRTGAAREALQLVTELSNRLSGRSMADRLAHHGAAGTRRSGSRAAVRLRAAGAHHDAGAAAGIRGYRRLQRGFRTHAAAVAPRFPTSLAQSLRGGTQTSRNLPADEPLVAAFLAMIDAPIREYIAGLRDGDRTHPVDRRQSRRIPHRRIVVSAPGSRRLSHQSCASAGLAELGVLHRAAGRHGRIRAPAGSSSANRECMWMAVRRNTSWNRSRECWCCFPRISGTGPCRSRMAAAG